MPLFCDFYRLGHEDGRQCALQIIFDLFFLYGKDYFCSEETKSLDTLTASLYDPDEAVQVIAAEGFAKLFLHRIICEEAVLEGLFQLYLHPVSCTNVKQCLSYFFQAFAFTSPANQLLIGGLIGRVLGSWAGLWGQKRILSLTTVSSQLFYLADAQNLIDKRAAHAYTEEYQVMYAQVALDLCWAILAAPGEAEVTRNLLSILVKVPLSALPAPHTHLKQLLFLTSQLLRYVTDKTSLNTLKRFSATLLQIDDQVMMPLESEVAAELAAQVQRTLPAGAVGGVFANQPAKKPKLTANNTHSTTTSTNNIMDEITDLLE